jgi:hypothetical protein
MARDAIEAKKAADIQASLASGRLVEGEGGKILPSSVVNARENAAQREETARLNRENTKAIAESKKEGGGIPESIVKDIGRLPGSWREWNASYPTRDSFSVRNNEQASAIALANGAGKVLPSKKQGDSMLAAKASLSDIGQAQMLLSDPEVREYVGAFQGKMTNFLAKGWADAWGGEKQVPTKVRKFRAALNRLNAEERHRIYGSALTNTESAFAEGFISSVDSSGANIEASLGEFADDLGRSMDAMWGSPGEGATAPAPKASGGIDPEVQKRLNRYK